MAWAAKAKKLGVISLATVAFSGFFPIAPGTAGTLVGALVLYGLGPLPIAVQVALCVMVLGVGVWVSGHAHQIFKKPDADYIVIDEVAGIFITMVGIPMEAYWLFIGILLFRLFDILKLPPAHFFDARMKNGWGVMLDDVTAGIYANTVLHLMLRTQI